MKPFISTPRRILDLGIGRGMRVLDIPGIGSFDMVTGQGIGIKKYSQSPWAFACMQIRGNELAGMPWHLVDRITGKVIQKHPIIDMLSQFGPESNYRESMVATEIEMCSLAKGFWLHDADIIQRLHAGSIEVKATNTGIQQFVQRVNGKVVNRFAREEIVYFHEYNPDSDLLPGPSIMDIVKTPISIEVESRNYADAFFKNDATPSLLLSTEQAVQEGEMNRIKDWWDKTFRGAKKAHKTAFADKGMKATILSTSMKDIAITAIHDQAVNDICVGFRVPRLLAGQFVEATYANTNEARVYLLENVMIPRGRYYEETINVELVWRIDPNVSFRFAPEELAILQEGQNQKWERLSGAIEKGAISLEFARAQMGWPETAAPSNPSPEQATLRAWKRKAARAVQSGSSADVAFETDQISPRAQAAIRARLAEAKTLADVDRAFQDD